MGRFRLSAGLTIQIAPDKVSARCSTHHMRFTTRPASVPPPLAICLAFMPLLLKRTAPPEFPTLQNLLPLSIWHHSDLQRLEPGIAAGQPARRKGG